MEDDIVLAAKWTALFGASIFGVLVVREAIFGNTPRRVAAAFGLVFAILRACGNPPPGPLLDLDRIVAELALAAFFVALAGLRWTSLATLAICVPLTPVGYFIMGSGRPIFSWVVFLVSAFDGSSIPIAFLALVTAGFTIFAAYAANGERDMAIAALGTDCAAASAAALQILPQWPFFEKKGDDDVESDTTSVTV
jgi:hypothetical protein